MQYNYLIEVSYDGTNFYGFQRQKKQRSVQGILEEAITQLNSNIPVLVKGSGRTDAKVHALSQICTFETDKNLDLKYFNYALNRLLPRDVHVKRVKRVVEDFHPRYHAIGKKYRYLINTSEYDVFQANYCLQWNRPLNIELMQEAAKLLIGKHDFRTFSSAREEQDTNKEIFSITITSKNDIMVIDYHGSGFLRYMVRKLTMILIDIGSNQKNIDDLKSLLLQKDIKAYSKIIGGEGLYLAKVYYQDEGEDDCYE